ncbi:hypothetical protein [Streptomyces sp. PSKA30]|uniref:hypothetical protein n=1 Tax=Streptomyces sp. PSKA30 TaxID=2874597 RepID=UPI001CD13945|nr:hypothetical protein [Streptomyces sp. PSKA30]MBZ9645788.1 hypothetical protein [Streptomyces sp. PSKA30]
MDEEQFAGLLAQVIPVAILAVVLEAKGTHESAASAAKAARDAGQPVQARSALAKNLRRQLGWLMFLAFLEVAALLTAAGEAGPVVRWFAGPPGALGTGVLLVVVGSLYVESVSKTYKDVGLLEATTANKVAQYAVWIQRILIALAIVVVLAFWMPWWDPFGSFGK